MIYQMITDHSHQSESRIQFNLPYNETSLPSTIFTVYFMCVSVTRQ